MMLFWKKNSFFRQNKAYAAVLLLQLLIILVLFYKAICTPASTLTIGAHDFSTSAQKGIRLEENRLFFFPDSDPAVFNSTPSPIQANSYYCSLGYGAYEITVHYRSHTTGDSRSFGATLHFQAEHLLEPVVIPLYDNRTSISSRMWLPFLDSWKDLLAVITYHGAGEVMLERIDLTESVAYRFVRLAGFVLLFMLVDLLYWILLSNRYQLKKNHIPWMLLGAVAFVSSIPFLNDFLYDGHDLIFHTQRISALAEELKNLQFPVRMFTAPNFGYGYPSPLYYCDIFLYLPALLYNCMLPMRTCLQLYVIGVNLVTAVIAYVCFSSITGRKRLGLLGAALYTLCMYRLTAVFVRSALGEYTAMAFLPLILLGMYRIYTSQKPGWCDWLPLSIGMTGIILSHIITTELVVFNLVLLCLVLIRRTLNVRRLLCIFKAAFLCALLTVWFWLPFLQTYFAQQVNVQSLEPYLMEYSGLYPAELFSLFVTGTGFSVLSGMQHSMPFTIGASLVFGMVCIIVCVLHQNQHQLGESNHLLRPVLLMVLINLLFTLYVFPWYRLQDALGLQEGGIGLFLNSLQHSWRFLSVTSALLTFGTLLAIGQIGSAYPQVGRRLAAALAAIIFVSAGSLLFEYTYNVSEDPFNVSDPWNYINDPLYFPQGSTLEDICSSSDISAQSEVSIRDYRKEKGIAYLDVVNGSDAASTVTLPIFAYQHYQAVDNSSLSFDISSSSGRIALTLPPHYSGTISIRFIAPKIWHAAEWVSLLTLIVLTVWWSIQLARRRKKALSQSI